MVNTSSAVVRIQVTSFFSASAMAPSRFSGRQAAAVSNPMYRYTSGSSSCRISRSSRSTKNTVDTCCTVAVVTAPLAAVLWGKPAQKYAAIFEKAAARRAVLVLESAHPSPLSAYRGFFGSAPFGKVNEFLKNNDAAKIDWCLPANATHS